MKEGAVLIVENSEGCVLLAKRGSECKNYAGHWEFPAGSVEEDERPIHAAAREAWEELRLYVKSYYWKSIGTFKSDRWLAHIYKTDIGNRTPTVGEPGKCEELVFVPVEDIAQYEPLTPDTHVTLKML
jgi:8-oxo-dGTP pyrophosphatase MutT (NUDIX family)